MKVDRALKTLQKGGLVIAPTDTVYGALVDGTNKKAVEKLIGFKRRPVGRAISVFVSDLDMLREYVEADRQQLETLKQLLPGAFTVVLKSKHRVSPLLESEDGTLGVRIPKYDFITNLVKKFGRPVTATSANISGKSPCYSIGALRKQLSKKKQNMIDLVIDRGHLPRNKPSTVLDLTRAEIRIIRKGDMRLADEQKFISSSPMQTEEIAISLVKNNPLEDKPLIFIIEGELGVGKTIFVKGIGKYFGITDIVSPTFVVYYEYDLKTFGLEKLIHCDLYNLQEEDEFEHLGIEKYLKSGNIICFEWGERTAGILDMLKEKGRIVYIKMKYISKNKREIVANF